MSRKTLKNKLDKVFSELIRSVGKCRKCGKTAFEVQLQCSHIYSRRHLSVRWDVNNAKCLCAKCHFWWGQNPLDAIEWLKTWKTEEELESLRQKANSIKKWTDVELENLYEELKAKL